MPNISALLEDLSSEFLTVHTKKEDLFWETKMGLGANAAESQEKLSQAEIDAQQFVQDTAHLPELREAEAATTGDEKKVIHGWIELFEANGIEDPKARELSVKIIQLEGKLQAARNAMDLGYIDPTTGQHVSATSTVLANMMNMEQNEPLRKAAYEGLRSIEPYAIQHGFLEIVKQRNALGRMLGYEDYYDMKVQRTEHFSKKELFRLLDDLEAKTRDRNEAAMKAFAEERGAAALEPWNFSFMRAGDLAKEIDPYFPFHTSLDLWVRQFSALGIRYRNATLTLDLIDRKGKYENGFMHGPVPSFYKNGAWNPARINFTANAMPNKIGAGQRALQTLFHEGGHAAHFSNILQNAPCFAQEFAPTSVAYAETQSMFCDSILNDADWRTRYAKTLDGKTMPFELIERSIRKSQPFSAFAIRAMLTICYIEKALYEMSDAELTEANVLTMIRGVERKMQALNAAPRPGLAVPHLLAGESSAYYHGYVLAQMAVMQTRAYFNEKYGYIMDNPHVGEELAKIYWAPGNSRKFFDLVAELTGKPFSADAIVESANRSIEEAVAKAKAKVEKLKTIPEYNGPFDLDASIRVVHGHETITSFTNGGLEQADKEFRSWVSAHYPSAN